MVYAVIVMAGKGARTNSDVPKQFIKIDDKEMFLYSLLTFASVEQVDNIVLVVPDGYLDFVFDIVKKHDIYKVSDIVTGGKTRQDSVRNALNSVTANDEDIVLIHDAARMFVSKEIIEENIKVARENGNAVTAIDAVDSLFDLNENTYINREDIKYIQTPQTFGFNKIKELHNRFKTFEVTDDATLFRKNGDKLFFVNGSKFNFKVTTSEDIELAKRMLK